jgi:hypothetical protein
MEDDYDGAGTSGPAAAEEELSLPKGIFCNLISNHGKVNSGVDAKGNFMR